MFRQSSYRHVTEPATRVNGADARCGAGIRHFLGISGGGGAVMRTLMPLISAVALAGLLTLTSSPAPAANECGTEMEGKKLVVVCEASDDDAEGTVFKNDQSGNRSKWRKAVILYEIHTPRKNRNRTGLKITLRDDIEVLGAFNPTVAYSSNYGLGVYATRNAADGILVESHARIEAALTAILVDTDIEEGDVVPITINVLKGVLSTRRGGNNGVIQVNDGGNHGKIIVNFSAEIKNVRDDNTGIYVYKYDAPGGDAEVTLKAGSRIGGEIHHGVHIESDGAGVVSGVVAASDFQVTIEKGAMIGTADAPVTMSGVYAVVRENELSAKKDVTVTHHGSLYARGDGIKIEHVHGDDATGPFAGGTATVTIGAAGLVKVTGDTNFGISLNTPDTVSVGGMRRQSATVYGKVFGGKNGGTIHLVGGGTLTFGPNAMLVPDEASDRYKTVRVTEAAPASDTASLVIRLDRNFRGVKNIENAGVTTFKYNLDSEDPGDTDYKDLTDGMKFEGLTLTALPCGIYSDCTGKETVTAEITAKDANNVFSLNFKNEITEITPPAAGQGTVTRRGRVYEALSSVMWDMVGALDTYMPSVTTGAPASASNPLQVAQNDMPAAPDQGMMADRRAWGSLEAGEGERRLQKAMSGNLSYDFSYRGFATGVDLSGVNDLMFRVGLHHRQGQAEVTDGGGVKVSGTGAGIGVARQYADGLMIDGWLGVTKYDDIEVRSSVMMNGQSIPVHQQTKGVGYVIGLGAAKRIDLGNLSLTQRGGLTWSSISVDDYVVSYTSMNESAIRGTVAQSTTDSVSMDSNSGATGRYGVLLEGEIGRTSAACCKLFSSLDLEHDFGVKRTVKVGSYEYKSESKPTRLRLGFGGSQFWNGDRSAVAGAVYLTSAGSGNHTVSGGVTLSIAF